MFCFILGRPLPDCVDAEHTTSWMRCSHFMMIEYKKKPPANTDNQPPNQPSTTHPEPMTREPLLRGCQIGILSVEWGCVISQVMKVLFQLWVPPKLCPAIVGCCFAISWHLLFEMSGWSLTFGSSFAAPKLRSFVVFQNLQNVDQAATNLTKLPFFTWPTKWNHWRVA